MILVDANLLLYAYLERYPQHDAAHAWLDATLDGETRVGLPWASLLAFVRISTSAEILTRPVPLGEAWDQVDEWLARPEVFVPAPTRAHARFLRRMTLASDARGRHVSDAHLAVLAVEHDLTLCSADVGFARFRGLRWFNPLVPPSHAAEPRTRYGPTSRRSRRRTQ